METNCAIHEREPRFWNPGNVCFSTSLLDYVRLSMTNGPDPNVWEHCSATAEGVGLDPVEALNLFLSSFDFIQKPTKIFFSFLQKGTKHMFL